MSEFSVVVRARRWQGPPQQLASTLAPVLGLSVEAAAAMLARGPVTVEADLSEAEARSLTQRLVQMGLPAQALHERELAIARAEDTAAASPPPTAQTRPVVPLFDDLSIDEPAAPQAQDTGAWGELFPDLGGAPRAAQPVAAAHREPPPSRSIADLFSFEDEAPIATPAAAPIEEIEPIATVNLFDDLEDIDLGLGFDAAPAPPPQPAPIIPAAPVIPSPALDFGAEVIATAPPPKPQPAPIDEPPRVANMGLQGMRLAEAMVEQAERQPPYAPRGFDDQPAHLPNLAAALSALAPGAGQIYNGDDEQSLTFGLTFWMIKPWIDGTRHAKRRAERIATYWAPRPQPGSLIRALRYALVWYLAVGGLSVMLGWVASRAYTKLTEAPVVAITELDVQRAIMDAHQHTIAARIAALDEAMKHVEEISSRGPVIDNKERADRLYRIGLQYCRARQLQLCEATMKRVTQLEPNHRDAFKLQVWSSVQLKGGKSAPMPAVSVDETLSDYELRQISADTGLPMPEPPKTPPPPTEDEAP